MAIYKENFSQDLTQGALSVSRGFNEDVLLSEVLIHASTNITETVKVIYNSALGANYTTELDSTNLTANDEYVFRPTGRCIFKKGDGVKVTVTSANTTGTVYGTIIAESIV